MKSLKSRVNCCFVKLNTSQRYGQWLHDGEENLLIILYFLCIDHRNMSGLKKLSNAEDYDDDNGSSKALVSTKLMTQVVELDTGITVTFTGYCFNPSKALFWYYAPSILTLGVWYVVNAWFLNLRVAMTLSECPISDAEWILGKNDEGSVDLRQVKRTFLASGQSVRYFSYRYIRFIYAVNLSKYIICNVSDMISSDCPTTGLTNSVVLDRRGLVGFNGFDIETKPWYMMLFDGILSPFNLFQVFAAIIWYVQKQAPYAISIIVLSVYAVISSLLATLRSYNRLKRMAYFSCPVNVLRDGEWQQMGASEHLVPGDVFEIDADMDVLPCDALLVSGEILLNESMLTGESIPVVRKSIPASKCLSSHLEDKGAILYAGTRVMRVRGGASRRALAVAIRTGFDTYKGFLIRQIMFPPPLKFKFYDDTVIYMIFLAVLAVIATLYTLTMSYLHKNTALTIFLNCADLITIVVPPALPTVLSVGIRVSIGRLRRAFISTTFPAKLNICGRLDIFCFDKTGTLTEEGLDICAIVGTCNPANPEAESSTYEESSDEELAVHQASTQRSVSSRGALVAVAALAAKMEVTDADGEELENLEEVSDTSAEPEERIFAEPVFDASDLSDKFFHLLSCCHTVTYVHDRLVGDPLDLKMFEFTGCVLDEPDHSLGDANVAGTVIRPFEGSGNELKIIRSFPFEASLKRQSVLIRDVVEESYEFYTKGAPEVIKEHCRPSTLPEDFDDKLGSYARHGQRVVACAYKRMPEDVEAIMQQPRDEIECDLNFLGFIVFENKLKDESPVAIHDLAKAGIRSIMVTGDNVLTAINVARKCGIVDEDCKMYFPVSDVVGPNGEVKFVDVEDSSEWLTDLPSFLLHHNPHSRRTAPDVQVALTGRIFSQLKERYSWPVFSALLSRCNIYARMSPLEKHELVEELQELDHCVAMVGDGANDCGALRIADVGVSLSQTEASLAAPFNSQIASISCAPLLVREGRAALTTSFSSFKYMTLYSFVQLTTAAMLLLCNGIIRANQFIAFDMITVLALGTFLTFAGTSRTLDHQRPSASLISTPIIGSIVLQTIVQIFFQAMARFFAPIGHEWGSLPYTETSMKKLDQYYNVVMIIASSYQYIWTALICGMGGKYRAPLIKNTYLVCWAAGLAICYTVLFVVSWDIYPEDEDSILDETAMEDYFRDKFFAGIIFGLVPMKLKAATRYFLVLMGLLNLLASVCAELVVLPFVVDAVAAYKSAFVHSTLSRRDQLAAYTIDDLEKSDLPTRPNIHKKPLMKKF